MRSIFLLFICTVFSLLLNAQVSKTVNIAAGDLSATLTPSELTTITNLTVTGTMDARDFKTMRDNMPLLAQLDLSGTTISSYTGSDGTDEPWSSYPANEIPAKAFYIYDPYNVGKTSLTSVLLPSSITSIGEWSFATCSGLSDAISFPSSVTNIGGYAFFSCSALTGPLSIPSSVKTIGEFAFAYCSKLTGTLTLPSAITSIGDNTFINCSKLTGALTIPSAVTTIGEQAFYNCSGFDGELTLPSSLTSIGRNAFTNCSNLTGPLTIPASITSIGHQTFEGCSSLNGKLTLPSSLQSIGSRAFIGCKGLIGELTLPSSLLSIGESAFYGCSGFTGSLTIPSSVTSVGIGAFFNCSGFNGKLTLPSSLTLINDHTFYGCSKLTGSLLIPSSVISIGRYAFVNCNKLNALTIPASVTSIGVATFNSCTGLTTIHAQGVSPLDLSSSPDVFAGVNFDVCKLKVPCGSSNLYANDKIWQYFLYITDENCPPVANAGLDRTVIKGSLVTLDGTGSTGETGHLTYQWTAPAGISLSSTTAQNPTFTAPEGSANLSYTFTLVVNDGALVSSPDQVVITTKNANLVPIAKSGFNQIVNEGLTVTLDGSLSSDPEGTDLSYKWTAPNGVTLSSTTAQKPTFTAPEVHIDTDLMFSLIVNDGENDSPADQVIITIIQINKTPVANAGLDQSVDEGMIVNLNGSASSDPDQQPLSYQWTAPVGILLSSSTSAKPTFIAPEVSKETYLTFKLIVNDGKEYSIADQVIITVNQVNKAPIAKTGLDQSVDEGTTVTLDGSLSSDPDESILTYQWIAPLGIVLSADNTEKPTFMAPEVKKDTVLTFTLVVNDGTLDSFGETVKVNVKNVIKVGTEELNASPFKIYPNPTNGIITIETGQTSGQIVNVTVFDLLGRVVYKNELTDRPGSQINLSELVNGKYVMDVIKGEKHYFEKLIIQK